jgi:hypothetical protein
MIVAILILVITSITIYIPVRFFREQRRKCQKYQFYKLRDEMVWEIINSDDPQHYAESYERINDSVGILHQFTLRLFLRAQAERFANYLTEALIERREPTLARKWADLNDFDKRYLELLGKTAQQNSLLLRFAMSKVGYKFFTAPVLISGYMKFSRRHRVKVVGRIKTAKVYSSLGEVMRINRRNGHGSGRAAA